VLRACSGLLFIYDEGYALLIIRMVATAGDFLISGPSSIRRSAALRAGTRIKLK